jgi:hypothetical protein
MVRIDLFLASRASAIWRPFLLGPGPTEDDENRAKRLGPPLWGSDREWPRVKSAKADVNPGSASPQPSPSRRAGRTPRRIFARANAKDLRL